MFPMPAKLTSVFGHAEAEYTIKKSRFIASLQEVHDEAEATAFLEQTRKQYWDARHNCYAYQLGEKGTLQKSSDDGEPAGTAGRPILEVLKKNGITNTIIVVTRYFGGIKLGASGLIRAYSHCAALGLETAPIADYIPHDILKLRFDYSFVNTIERLLPVYTIIATDRQFSDTVCFTLQVPQDQSERFQRNVTNSTNGTARWEESGTLLIPVLRKA